MKVSRREFLQAAGPTAGLGLASGTAGAAEAPQPDFGGYLDGAQGGEFADRRGTDAVTVEVGAGQTGLAFLPTSLWISPGTTVTFEWSSNNHNVVPESQPSGANWGGSEGDASTTYNQGHSFEFTFETTGIYTYYCAPHETVGMLGGIAVGESVPTVTPGGGGGGISLPGGSVGSALVLAAFGAVGLAAATVLGSDVRSSLHDRAQRGASGGPVSLTEEQLETLEDGQPVEVTTEDGRTVTVTPPD